MRLLILACSAIKRHDLQLLPALYRYDGPAWRTLRAYLQRQAAHAADRDVYALSAEFGLIPAIQPIPNDDRRMDAARAAEIRSRALGIAELATRIRQVGGYQDTLICGGRQYHAALPDPLPSGFGVIHCTSGGIGQQLGQFKTWLEREIQSC